MIENDNVFDVDSNCAPTIWEQKWYNMNIDESVSEQYGYRRGDAVWINTESLNEYTTTKSSEIYEYVMNNDDLRTKYYRLSGDDDSLFDFYTKIVNGTAIDGKGPLYYLGDITKKVQIRVSLSSSNTALPTDDNYWKDFFPTNNEEKMRLSVMEELKSQMDACLSAHIQNYHLGGISSVYNVQNAYANSNLTNLTTSAYQYYQKYHPDVLKGKFDYVRAFVKKDYPNEGGYKLCKWYRLWNSGYLEHGGIVDCNDPTKTGDSFGYSTTGKDLTVNPGAIKINLQFQDGVPDYDYSNTGLEPFYSLDKNIRLNGNDYKYNTADNINQNTRYVVYTTPIGKEYSSELVDGHYMSNEVNTLTNNSFCAVLNGNPYLSYHCVGFTFQKDRT